MQRKLIRIIGFVAIFSTLSQSFAQDYSSKVKLLEQHGIPYFYNEDIAANIDKWIKNDSGKTSAILGKLNSWNPELEAALKEHGLPWFVKYIAAANTGMNNNFLAKDGSSGIWPLNFTIAKKYELRQNSLMDERLAIAQSSAAACKYIQDLQFIYKDWLKTITAFKIGAVRLNQVIHLAGGSLNFKDIYTFLEPKEREPILQFYAATTVFYFKNDFHLTPIPVDRIAADTVSANTELSFALIYDKLGISPEEMKILNPEFKIPYVPYFGGTTYFRIPASKKGDYNLIRDSLHKIVNFVPLPAVQYDTIQKVVDSVTYIQVVPRNDATATEVIPEKTQEAARVWIWYRVKSGDGFYTLSDVFDCSIQEMKNWNGIYNNTLIANSMIKFYVLQSKLADYQKINGMNHAQKRNLALQD